MADRLQLAAEIKQLQEDHKRREEEFKEAQVSLDTKKTQLVQANIDELG